MKKVKGACLHVSGALVFMGSFFQKTLWNYMKPKSFVESDWFAGIVTEASLKEQNIVTVVYKRFRFLKTGYKSKVICLSEVSNILKCWDAEITKNLELIL